MLVSASKQLLIQRAQPLPQCRCPRHSPAGRLPPTSQRHPFPQQGASLQARQREAGKGRGVVEAHAAER